MSFEHERGHTAIRFIPAGVSGASAVDGYLLRLSVEYQMTPWSDEFGEAPQSFHNFRARAELGPGRLRLGRPTAEVPLIITPHDYAQTAALMFELLLPASTIDKIEVHRAGGDFEIFLQLTGERIEATHPEYDDVLFRIGQSHWVTVLEQMNFGAFLLCEIPIELGDDEELKDVWAAVSRARELLYNGHYRNAVVECRKALETAMKQFTMDVDIRSAAKRSRGKLPERQSMSKRERLLSLVDAATQVMHLAAHPDTNNDVVDFSRREALLILSITATAISEFGERKRYENASRRAEADDKD